MARMKEKYNAEIAPALMKKFEYKSVMQIPKLDKIVVNVGCGEAKNNCQGDRSHLQGHRHHHRPEARHHARPVSPSRTSRSVKARHVGVKVTLRGDKM